MKEISQQLLLCCIGKPSDERVKLQSEREIIGNNGVKYVVCETFSEDINKDLQDILVIHMLTDRLKLGNNR